MPSRLVGECSIAVAVVCNLTGNDCGWIDCMNRASLIRKMPTTETRHDRRRVDFLLWLSDPSTEIVGFCNSHDVVYSFLRLLWQIKNSHIEKYNCISPEKVIAMGSTHYSVHSTVIVINMQNPNEIWSQLSCTNNRMTITTIFHMNYGYYDRRHLRAILKWRSTKTKL